MRQEELNELRDIITSEIQTIEESFPYLAEEAIAGTVDSPN